ncbi:MAG: sodium ion-translocating decarboxylase subunit beta, partial [Porticoccaceae bacterium]|nr:sodium ion-translocating decarboxylase subunit beta [Porticoccaceae bacterium]
MENLLNLWASSGLAQIQLGQLVMMAVGLGLLFLAISKGFEPLLLVPIGFGTILANIPGAGFDAAPVYDALGQMESPGGLLYYIYH